MGGLHAGSGLRGIGVGCGGMSSTSLCIFWCIVCGLSVIFRWSVKISSRRGLLEEHHGAFVQYIKCNLAATADVIE